MSEDKSQAGTGVLLFLLGAAVGALAVALLTPRTGPQLRADLKERLRELTEDPEPS